MAAREPSASVQQLSAASLDVLEQQIARGELSDDLRAVFGETAAAELEEMAQVGSSAVLGDEDRPLVVLLPGVTGSTLMNISGDTGLIWLNPLALAAGKLNLLRLDASGAQDQPGVQVVPAGLIPTHYLLIQMHLKTLGGCDVLSFPFDWRRSPMLAAERLRDFVMGQFHQHNRKVHLVGHSMGGLVAREFCARYPHEASQAVEQVVQLGTPNYGSYTAVQNLVASGGLVSLVEKLNPANKPLAFTRSCTGLYAMFPAPQEFYPADAPHEYPYITDIDPYDADVYGISEISAAHLHASRAAYENGSSGDALPVPVTIIAGYGLPTCVGMVVNRDSPAPMFDLSTHMGDGDGTVPLASVTALPGANLYYGHGLKHGDLPLYGVVRRAVIDLVHRREPQGLETIRGAGVLGGEDPAATLSVEEAPDISALDEAALDAIAERIRYGTASPADLRILAQL